ncbi:MAG: ATP synthase subunit I [Gammaproteobacteria bacterium]
MSDHRPSLTLEEDHRFSPQRRTLRWSIVSAFGAAAVMVGGAVVFGLADVRSTFLGASVGFIASSYAAFIGLFLRAEEAGKALSQMYRGEFGKLLITGTLCAFAFGLIEELNAGTFLIALIGTLISSTLGAVLEQINADRRHTLSGNDRK